MSDNNQNKFNLPDILNKEVKVIINDFFNGGKNSSKKTFQSKAQKKPAKKNLFLKIDRKYLVGLVLLFFVFGLAAGIFSFTYLPEQLSNFSPRFSQYFSFWQKTQEESNTPVLPLKKPGFSDYQPQTSQEEAVIKVVKQATVSVVSIIVTKEVPVYEKYYEKDDLLDGNPFLDIEIEVPKYREKGTEKKRVGGGTGFIVSEDGMVLTNKHVVSDKEAEYTVITNQGEKYSAEVLARDPLQDLAVLKVKQEKEMEVVEQGELKAKLFPVLELGDSSQSQIGQTVIAIGNALGEFRNTISVGVISGLGRKIVATGGGVEEVLEDVIQTDAAINRGNSGGPLLNLKGKVIGVNVAVAEGAQSIGFSLPINKVKRSLEQVKTEGRIVYPFLGIRYVMLNPEIQEENGLSIDKGAFIVGGKEQPGIVADSSADKAGLKEDDIILEIDGQAVDSDNLLSEVIKQYLPGDTITLKVLRGKEELILSVALGEISSED